MYYHSVLRNINVCVCAIARTRWRARNCARLSICVIVHMQRASVRASKYMSQYTCVFVSARKYIGVCTHINVFMYVLMGVRVNMRACLCESECLRRMNAHADTHIHVKNYTLTSREFIRILPRSNNVSSDLHNILKCLDTIRTII